MRNDDKRAPALRLAGFEGEWETAQFGSLGHVVGGTTPSTAVPEYWGGTVPWFTPAELSQEGSGEVAMSKRGITERAVKESGLRILPSGSVLITSRASIGHVAVNTLPATTNQGFASLIPFKNESLWFAYYWVLAHKSVLETQSSGSTFLEISRGKLGEIQTALPSLGEQGAIGTALHSLDSIIDATVSKSDSLTSLKQTMLVKMFPQGTASVPEVRFEAFGGEWKARRLGDLSESFSGGTPAASHAPFYGGDIPFIRSAEIGSETTALTLTSEGLRSSSARLVETGDVLYALYGATAGEVGLSKLRGAINQAILAIYPDDTLDREFLVYWFTLAKRRILDTYLQGGQGNLSGTLVKSFELEIPPLPEQQAIGSYFRNLDALIDAEQKKLETLRNLKNALLTQMFV